MPSEVKKYADRLFLSLGKAVSVLLGCGLNAPVQTKVVNGMHVVVLPKNSTPVDSEDVKRLLGDSPQKSASHRRGAQPIAP